MEDFLTFLGGFSPLLAIILLVVIVIVVQKAREARRTRTLEATGAALGFQFGNYDEEGLRAELDGIELFSQGHSRRIYNVLSGEAEGVEVFIFDYQYTVGHGKHSTTHKQTVVLLRESNRQIPQFILRPSHLFDRLGEFFGYSDINFESHPVFSRQYTLKGRDPQAVRQLFTAEALAFFESNQKLVTEARGPHLVVYRKGNRVRPDEVRALWEEGWAVHQVLGRPLGGFPPSDPIS